MYDMTMFFGHAYIALKLTRWRVSRNQRPEIKLHGPQRIRHVTST